MQPLFDLTPYTTDTPTKDTQGLALFDWALVQETKQVQPAQVEIPLPSDALWTEYNRVLYVTTKGEKGAHCTHCKQYASNRKQLKAVGQGWGECENVFCNWRNIKRDQQAGTVESAAWVQGHKEHHALTFPVWYEQASAEVQAESDYPAISWTTWDKLHRAWLSGKAPSDTADDLLYNCGFRHNWDDDETESDEDTVLGA